MYDSAVSSVSGHLEKCRGNNGDKYTGAKNNPRATRGGDLINNGTCCLDEPRNIFVCVSAQKVEGRMKITEQGPVRRVGLEESGR